MTEEEKRICPLFMAGLVEPEGRVCLQEKCQWWTCVEYRQQGKEFTVKDCAIKIIATIR